MRFEKNNGVIEEDILGKKIGYFLMFLVFSIILYFILSFFQKIPESWNYPHIFLVSIFIVLIGKGIGSWLER